MTTAQKFRQEAAAYDLAAQDSFERCDTDGFLSQWAHGINAELARTRAKIAENGGTMPFEVLMQDNRRVDAKLVDGKFGACWLLSDDEEANFGRKFIPFAGQGGNSRIQKQLGFNEEWEEAPAAAKITGRGIGLSGNAWVVVFRTDGK